MNAFNENGTPNNLECKSCEYSGDEYQFISQHAHPLVERGIWYTKTIYLCKNCNIENVFIWELGDCELGILGRWNGDELLDEKRKDNYPESAKDA